MLPERGKTTEEREDLGVRTLEKVLKMDDFDRGTITKNKKRKRENLEFIFIYVYLLG